MVWLTGGGNHSQSGEGTGAVVFNGERLVPQGVVFVSYNARLGVFGYLAHPALDAERSEKISGNYGSLDHIAMLRWLKHNIAAFGGDPNKIFLFGTSAGGGNICALVTSPLSRGLFHGVAMQSSVPMDCEIQTLKDAQEGTGRRVAAAVGCDTGDVAACLRNKSVSELLTAVPGTFSVLPRLYGPNMDGRIFPDQPLKLIAAGKYPSMPVIIGNTSDETLGWADTAGRVTDESSYAAAIERVFGSSNRERILALYPPKSYPTPELLLRSLQLMRSLPARADVLRGSWPKCSGNRFIGISLIIRLKMTLHLNPEARHTQSSNRFCFRKESMCH